MWRRGREVNKAKRQSTIWRHHGTRRGGATEHEAAACMGHLVSMIELGKVFAARGLAVTVVVVDPPYGNTGVTGAFLAGVTAAYPAITFHRLPKVEVPPVASKHHESLIFEVTCLSNPSLRDFLASVLSQIPRLSTTRRHGGTAES
uniref:Uncharacterized protein n=1 Tax=Oryza meridionalis TaxID=40149 RepID=A0A0E0C960_9ORYZ